MGPAVQHQAWVQPKRRARHSAAATAAIHTGSELPQDLRDYPQVPGDVLLSVKFSSALHGRVSKDVG